jgi:glucokinase-like ROK family protein
VLLTGEDTPVNPDKPRVSRREVNRFLIVNCLRKKRRLSRVDLARELGLTASAISNITSDLIREGYIRECGVGTSPRGRKPVLLELRSSVAHAIGIDLEHLDRVDVSVVDLECNPLVSVERPISRTDPDYVVTEIAAAVDELLGTSGIPRRDVFGVGVGVPGIVDYETGVVIRSTNLGWDNTPLRAMIERAISLSTYIDNGANIAALGEYWYGDLDTRRDFAYVSVGRGIGSGLVIDGKVYRGRYGSAGEFGHVIVAPNGAKCPCGTRGCLEAYAAEPAVLKWVAHRFEEVHPGRGAGAPEHARELYEAANSGDDVALEAIHMMGRYLGIGITSLINLLSPETVVLGGHVWRVMDLLLEEIRRTVAENAITLHGRSTNIVASSLGADTGIVGAATLVLEEVFRAPVFKLQN